MGYIREPKGVDLIVGPSVLTKEDRRMIGDVIADYKKTGKVPRGKRASGLVGFGSAKRIRKRVLDMTSLSAPRGRKRVVRRRRAVK